jgi:hypothetical protein
MANLRDSTSALSNDRTNLIGNYARSFEGEPSSNKQLHPAFRENAQSLTSLARGLGAVDVAHMRSALGLSSTYRQQKGWHPLLRKTSAAALA